MGREQARSSSRVKIVGLVSSLIVAAGIGSLITMAMIDPNSAEPVEECIFGFLGVDPELRENITPVEVEDACDLPAGDVQRITEDLVRASESG